jgi:hypothetical protein
VEETEKRTRGFHKLERIAEKEGFIYEFFDGIVLIEEDTAEAHRESVRLTEEDALKIVKGMPVRDIRRIMYDYSPYQ